MSITSIQGRLLEVTVVGCSKLKDTEWISRQDPYVVLEYGTTKFRTRTCTDGGKHPVFQEKFTFTLIEGLREIHAVVSNSNTINRDDFIGSGKVQLQDALTRGYDDRSWSLQTKTGRYAGEVKLIMHYNQSNMQASNYAPSAPPYGHPTQAQPPPAYSNPYTSYPPPPSSGYPPQTASYTSYPPCDPSYPPGSAPYSASQYPPPVYESTYPPPTYPPPPYGNPPPYYPPPPYGSPYHRPPPGHYPGMHPPY